MSDVKPLLDALRTLGSGRVIAGRVWMNEEEFYVLTTRIKKWMDSGDSTWQPPLSGSFGEVIRIIDNCENTVQQGFHFLGKAIINRSKFEQNIDALRFHSALKPYSELVEKIAATGTIKGRWVIGDEEEFFISIVKLKKGLAQGSRPAPTEPPKSEESGLRELDELERFVEDTAFHVFAFALVNQVAYQERVKALATALAFS